ncbi:MAG: A/G-specific adenine glycosylase [Inquilinus sp.]|nr:A/G-specific adenine glycosylase [Inquilinus sp.]
MTLAEQTRIDPKDAAGRAAALLDWYDRHRRVLPWRAPPGGRADPYHVWLSEVMLQQTTVATVAGYFHRFLERWPTVADLAAAELDDVLREWAGLGYYARARNLHKCARVVADRGGGHFPQDEQELRQLPGVGTYTAAAIAAIAFDRPAAVMDGNVERVVARLFAVEEPLPAAKPKLLALTAVLSPADRPGDFAQAMMDLGAMLCVPRKPKCVLCPWRDPCVGRLEGIADALPAKAPKRDKPTRRAVVFWATDPAGAVLLRRRPEKGLLGGMIEIPSSAWCETRTPPVLDRVRGEAPVRAAWRPLPGLVRHTFTHFHLELAVAAGRVAQRDRIAGLWVPVERFSDHALPTVMRKVARHALTHSG